LFSLTQNLDTILPRIALSQQII